MSLARRFALRIASPLTLASLFGAGCLLVDTNQIAITYDLDPQEFVEDFGNQMGTVPAVDCTAGGDAVCQQLPTPMGTTAHCDTGATNKCQLTAQIELSQMVDLASEKSFPSSVANSSAINSVTVNRVLYWTPSNTLSFATPPIDLFVGPQTAQKSTDAGVAHLGTVPPLAAGGKTACRTGTPGTMDSACSVPLDKAGQDALAAFAKDYKTPFNVFVEATYTAKAGDPMPSGKLDLFVQPEIGYSIPLTK